MVGAALLVAWVIVCGSGTCFAARTGAASELAMIIAIIVTFTMGSPYVSEAGNAWLPRTRDEYSFPCNLTERTHGINACGDRTYAR